jgi:hypothetical protein
VLPEVTTGLLLNALLFSALSIISILCLLGEFTIRSYLRLRDRPHYIIREILSRGSAEPGDVATRNE